MLLFVVVTIYENIQSNFFKQSFILARPTQPAFTCSKLTIETLEQGVK